MLTDWLNRLQWFPIVIWAIVPPFALMLVYHRRIRAAPPLRGTMLLFGLGMLAGLFAWSIESLLAVIIQALPPSMSLSQTAPESILLSSILWQTAVVAPAAEACKLVTVVLPVWWLLRRYRRLPAQPSTVLLATIAVALGFAAQTSLVALWYRHESVVEMLMLMPMQAIFSMAWGFSLGVFLCRMPRQLEYSSKLIMHSWLAACLCHAGWNGILAVSRSLEPVASMPRLTPVHLLYLLFAWALWLWWQTERMLHRSQGEIAPHFVTAQTSGQLIVQYVLIGICLGIGGAALNAFRDFGNRLQLSWELRITFDQGVAMQLGTMLLQTVIYGAIALYLFYRLRRPAAAE